MRIFVVTVARSGVLPPDVDQRVRRALDGRMWLFRERDQTQSWTSASGAVRIDVISNEPTSLGPLIQTYGSGAAATFTGRIDDPTFVADPTFTADRADPGRVAGLPGIFALVRASDEGAEGFTSVHRMEPLYLAQGPDLLVLSSSARAAHAVAGIADRTVPLDALLSLSGTDHMMHDVTPFPGVTAVPADSRVLVRPGGVSVTPLPRADLDPAAPVEEVIDRFVEALVAAATAAARGGTPLVELTGGKDSRLVVAALSAAGVDFTTMTVGHDALPDVVLARRIAALLGVPHELQPVARADGIVEADPARRTWTALVGTEGMARAYDSYRLDGHFDPRDIRIGGNAGELLRGGEAMPVGASSPGEVTARVLDFLAPQRELLLPEARQRLLELVQPWVDLHHDDPYRASFELDRTEAMGRWYGVLRVPRTIRGHRRNFLADNQLVRLAMTVEPRAAAHERLMHDALHRLRPDLCSLPFVGGRWAFEADGPTPWCDPGGWADRAPVQRLGGSAWDWRDKYPTEVHHHFAEVIMSAPWFDTVFDRPRTEEALAAARSPNRGYAQVKRTWSLYTAAQLLLGLGRRATPPSEPVFELVIPALASQVAESVIRRHVDGRDFALCTLCDATFALSAVDAGRCPSCGLGVEHRGLRYVLDNYGNVFQRRAVVAVGATVPAERDLFAAAASLRELSWAGEATLRTVATASQDAVALVDPPPAEPGPALVRDAARVLRPGGVLVSVAPVGESAPALAGLAAEAGLTVTTLPGLDTVTRRSPLVVLAYRTED